MTSVFVYFFWHILKSHVLHLGCSQSQSSPVILHFFLYFLLFISFTQATLLSRYLFLRSDERVHVFSVSITLFIDIYYVESFFFLL